MYAAVAQPSIAQQQVVLHLKKAAILCFCLSFWVVVVLCHGRRERMGTGREFIGCNGCGCSLGGPHSRFGKKLSEYRPAIKAQSDSIASRGAEGVQALHNTSERTGSAIHQHAKKVRRECLRFEGLVRQVWAYAPTGDPTEEQVLTFCTAMYYDQALVSKF